MGRKHYELPGYDDHHIEAIVCEQQLSFVAERHATAALTKMRSWTSFRRFFNSPYRWEGVDEARWRETMN